MIIFDLDSTLVDARGCAQLMGDWEAYAEALALCPPYQPMFDLAKLVEGETDVVVITGRSSTTRASTLAWLGIHGLTPDQLLMRPEMNTQSEPELFLALWRDYDPLGFASCILTGREKIAEAFRAVGVQSLLVTPMVAS